MKNSKPLDGIKIVEISTIITASLATMMLADQGAEVIKIEQSGIGDPMRYLGTQKGGISALFANCIDSERGDTPTALSPKHVAKAKSILGDAGEYFNPLLPKDIEIKLKLLQTK